MSSRKGVVQSHTFGASLLDGGGTAANVAIFHATGPESLGAMAK